MWVWRHLHVAQTIFLPLIELFCQCIGALYNDARPWDKFCGSWQMISFFTVLYLLLLFYQVIKVWVHFIFLPTAFPHFYAWPPVWYKDFSGHLPMAGYTALRRVLWLCMPHMPKRLNNKNKTSILSAQWSLQVDAMYCIIPLVGLALVMAFKCNCLRTVVKVHLS